MPYAFGMAIQRYVRTAGAAYLVSVAYMPGQRIWVGGAERFVVGVPKGGFEAISTGETCDKALDAVKGKLKASPMA